MNEETKKVEPRLDHWEKVDSTNIAEIRYNSAQVRLEVRFKRQGPKEFYVYQNVARGTWLELMAAPSQTKFLNAQIKGKFSCVKMEQVARMDDPGQAQEDAKETERRNVAAQKQADRLAVDEGGQL